VIICVLSGVQSRLGPEREALPGRAWGRDTAGVESGAARDAGGVDGRFLAVDEQGVGLRATWRPERGFVNLSLWRGDQCVETFHLTPGEVSALVGFLVSRLATLAPPAVGARLRVVEDPPAVPPGGRVPTAKRGGTVAALRSGVAAQLRRAAERITP